MSQEIYQVKTQQRKPGKWTQHELMTLDLRTTKLPAMQGALQQTADISLLYFRRKEERRMLISVEGTVRLKKRNLGSYLSQSKLDKLLKAA